MLSSLYCMMGPKCSGVKCARSLSSVHYTLRVAKSPQWSRSQSYMSWKQCLPPFQRSGRKMANNSLPTLILRFNDFTWNFKILYSTEVFLYRFLPGFSDIHPIRATKTILSHLKTQLLRVPLLVRSLWSWHSCPPLSSGHMCQDPQRTPHYRWYQALYLSCFPIHIHLWRRLIYKLGTVREYKNCQHHCSVLLGSLWSKISVTWTQAPQRQTATKWLTGSLYSCAGQRTVHILGGTRRGSTMLLRTATLKLKNWLFLEFSV